MKFEEWVKGIENAAIKGLCSTHPNICKMIYNEGQKDIEKALKDKGVCLQSELDELQKKYKELKKENAELKERNEGYNRNRDRLKEIGFPTFMSCKEYAEQINKMKNCANCRHFSEPYKLCCYSLGDEDYDCRGRKWQIKENE